MSWRIRALICSTSRRFNRGRITVEIFAWRAARTFSLTPPIGRTSPRSVISPVIATSRRTFRSVKAEIIAAAMVMPADGPSLGIDPSGTWTCTSCVSKKSSAIPRSAAWARAYDIAALPRQAQPPLPAHGEGLDEEDVASRGGPGESGRDPDLVLLQDLVGEV